MARRHPVGWWVRVMGREPFTASSCCLYLNLLTPHKCGDLIPRLPQGEPGPRGTNLGSACRCPVVQAPRVQGHSHTPAQGRDGSAQDSHTGRRQCLCSPLILVFADAFPSLSLPDALESCTHRLRSVPWAQPHPGKWRKRRPPPWAQTGLGLPPGSRQLPCVCRRRKLRACKQPRIEMSAGRRPRW